MMKNPWEEIPLADYENHMKLDTVLQLQTLNEMMKGQFDTDSVSSMMMWIPKMKSNFWKIDYVGLNVIPVMN